MVETPKANILVVDDTETNIDTLVEILENDYEVSVATDAESALDLVEENTPDIILLDIMMPGMDGYEVCRRIKSSQKTKDIPVVFITAMGEVEDETKGFELGAVDYIHKPIIPSIVKARVQSILKLKHKTEELATLSRKLSKYLAPQVYISIFRGEQDVEIMSKRKKLTIYFSDIVSFTETTEGMEAEDLSDLLNSYLEEMSAIAIKHGGTIDKFIGDAILIFFGDPLSRGLKEDALACVSMALEMREAMKKLQKKWYSFGIKRPFQVRAGITSGYCTVGNFGSKSRMDYTIIGSQVNISSRLEQSADPDQIIISHETWSLIKDLVYCVKQKLIEVKGINRPIQTYQIVDFIEKMSQKENAVTIGFLSEPAFKITPSTTVRELKLKMQSESANSAAVVVDNERVQGLVMNHALLQIQDSREDIALYFDQPVIKIMDGDVYSVESETPLHQVASQILERDRAKVYDPVVVTENGVMTGVVPVYRVFEKLADLDLKEL
jgi:class 3 adenylate cyclase/CheY-like chemotaxis protein/CBS domain-containing protein